jgi:hypothetical protein
MAAVQEIKQRTRAPTLRGCFLPCGARRRRGPCWARKVRYFTAADDLICALTYCIYQPAGGSL